MLRRLGPARDRAVSRGINKTQDQVTTHSDREIRKRYRSLKAGTVKKSMLKRRSTPRRGSSRRLTATIINRGRTISLKDYKGTRVIKGRGRGKRRGHVYATVIPGQRKRVSGAFLGPNGHVYRRKGRRRLPIQKLFGPSIPSAFVKETLTRSMQKKSSQVGPRLIENQLRFELSRL